MSSFRYGSLIYPRPASGPPVSTGSAFATDTHSGDGAVNKARKSGKVVGVVEEWVCVCMSHLRLLIEKRVARV